MTLSYGVGMAQPVLHKLSESRVARGGSRSNQARLVLLVPTALMVAVLAFRLHEAVPAVSSILRPGIVLGVGGFFFMLVQASAVERGRIVRDRAARFTAFYLLWALLTIPTAMYIGRGVATIKVIYTILFITSAFAMIPASERSLNWCIRALALIGGLTAAAALLKNQIASTGRLGFGDTLDPNDIAAVMAVAVALSLGAARRAAGVSKLLFLACTALAVAVVFKTGSRGGFLALIVTLIIFVFAVPGAKRMVWLGMVSVGVLGFWFAAPQSTRDRFATITDLESDYNTSSYFGREEIWKRGIGYAVSNPFLGVGLGNFEIAEGAALEDDGSHGKWSTAHNAYVQSVAEVGFPGFFFFLYLWITSLRTAWRWTPFGRRSPLPRDQMRPELLAVTLGLAVAVVFLSFAYSWIVFAVFGLVNLADRTYSARIATPALPRQLSPSPSVRHSRAYPKRSAMQRS